MRGEGGDVRRALEEVGGRVCAGPSRSTALTSTWERRKKNSTRSARVQATRRKSSSSKQRSKMSSTRTRHTPPQASSPTTAFVAQLLACTESPCHLHTDMRKQTQGHRATGTAYD